MLKSGKDRFTLMTYAGDRYTGTMYGRSSCRIVDQRSGKEVFHTGNRPTDSYLWLVDIVDNFEEYRRTLLSGTPWYDEAEGK